ncbi:transcriptional regulator [Mycobacterium antarcticum]|nr:transcriptional regulator [Mycolicibacterium sp. TUM20985]
MEVDVTDSSRESRVLDAVVTVVDSLLGDFDVVELLTDLTEHCSELLDVSAAGLLLAGPGRQLHLMAATSESSRLVELSQLHADQGPCVDCYSTAAPVSVPDLSAQEQRWPDFVPAAIEAGFASVHAVPMRAAGLTLGALGLFGADTGELSEADLLVAHTLAHLACVAIMQGHPSTAVSILPRLHTAVNNRVIIEQAKGFVSAAIDVPVPNAYSLLRSYARANHVHLSEVCRRMISDPDTREVVLSAVGSTQAELS